MDGPFCNPQAREWLNREQSTPPPTENPIWKGLERFKGKDLND